MKKFLIAFIIFTLVISIGGVVSAEEITFPAFPSYSSFANNVYIGDYDNGFAYQIFSTTGTLIINSDGNYTTEEGVDIKCNVYTVSNGQWKLVNGYQYTAKIVIPDYYLPTTLYYGATDVYDYRNNTVFFSIPKTPPYLMDNQTLLQPLYQSVIQNSQILLLCGVGILSLILSVGLFRKLYLYL